MTRRVHCLHSGQEAEGLDFVPWPGELGRRVFAGIGKDAWGAWLAHQLEAARKAAPPGLSAPARRDRRRAADNSGTRRWPAATT